MVPIITCAGRWPVVGLCPRAVPPRKYATRSAQAGGHRRRTVTERGAVAHFGSCFVALHGDQSARCARQAPRAGTDFGKNRNLARWAHQICLQLRGEVSYFAQLPLGLRRVVEVVLAHSASATAATWAWTHTAPRGGPFLAPARAGKLPTLPIELQINFGGRCCSHSQSVV